MSTPIKQPFTYNGVHNPNSATVVPLTDNNMGPMAAIWMLMSLNISFRTNAHTGLPNAAVAAEVAKSLGVTPETVQHVLDFAHHNGHDQAFLELNNAFQNMVLDPGGLGYTGVSCPHAIVPNMTTLLAALPAPTM